MSLYCEKTKFVCDFLQDLLKVEAKLQEKHFKEKEQEERQRRIAAKLKNKVWVVWSMEQEKKYSHIRFFNNCITKRLMFSFRSFR